MGDIQQAFWIRNAEKAPVLLCLEPWGNETQLTNGKEYVIVFEGPAGKWPAIEWSKDRITVNGWSGSVAAIYCNGELILDCSLRVPPMPEPQ